MKSYKISVSLIVLIGIITTIIGVTFSYFLAKIIGAETTTTITAESGFMNIVYDGGPTITAQNIAPSTTPFATKNFTVTGTSNINSSTMPYKVIIKITENTLSNNAISYTLKSTNTSVNGTVIPNINERQGLGSTDIDLGSGIFNGPITNGVHTYEMKFYFYETEVDQSADMNKSFKAYISIVNQ